jgi:ADP-heptose:LPS heptosyltransferase
MAWDLRRRRYDVVFNLHGGTTATFFTVASRARHRVGVASYQYAFLYNHLLSSASDYWRRRDIHSAEQQLALLGFAGVPVDDLPMSLLPVTPEASLSLEAKFVSRELGPLDGLGDYALVHPTAAFATKQWATENFAMASEYLFEKGLRTIAIAAPFESAILRELESASQTPVISFNDLTLPEITVLASRAKVFVGNDSGIAHIAAAVNTPSVVIFGSSSRTHWRPWTDAPNEVVYEEWPCQPCAGYTCEVFGEPKCILSVKPASVLEAIGRLLDKG